ncbi:aquaporin [Streptomyces ipomoeae]|nr:aquaporin [Streptomyces ipomoeae]
MEDATADARTASGDAGPESPPEASSWYALYEFALVTVLLFGVVSAVRLFVVPSSALAVSGLHLALADVGAVVGVLVFLLIRSAWGRRSGAHMNPAVSVGLWLMGALPRPVCPAVRRRTGRRFAGRARGWPRWYGVRPRATLLPTTPSFSRLRAGARRPSWSRRSAACSCSPW